MVHLSNVPESKYPLISHNPKDQLAQCTVLFSAEGSKVWFEGSARSGLASMCVQSLLHLQDHRAKVKWLQGQKPTHLTAWLPEPKDACRHPACLSSWPRNGKDRVVNLRGNMNPNHNIYIYIHIWTGIFVYVCVYTCTCAYSGGETHT